MRNLKQNKEDKILDKFLNVKKSSNNHIILT